MSEMVERVARALSENCGSFTGDTADTLVRNVKDGQMIPRWRLFDDMARAAIAAMREPTQKMTDAATIDEISASIAYICWADMIVAALADDDEAKR